MIVTVTETTMVMPSEETPSHVLWTSNVDQLFKVHMPSVYLYRQPDLRPSTFFDLTVLKSSLAKALVPFYPIAGRLRTTETGRREIDCNAHGALFAVAEADSDLIELGDFAPSQELSQLVPRVNTTTSSSPLLLIQITFFKCGGVAVGVALEHSVVDGTAGTNFIKSWCEVARRLDISTPPFLDRTVLRARDPPKPSFPHVEHHPVPTMKPSVSTTTTTTSTASFKITREQINLLKAKCASRFSTYEVLAGHIWRCACRARRLEDDQETKLSIAVDGRLKLRPTVPAGYLGNVIFHKTPMGTSGELLSNELAYTVGKIHEELVQANDEYLRSALDYLEVHPDIKTLVRGPHSFGCPNIAITSWCGMPIHDADFGWGRPIYMGPPVVMFEGLVFILPRPTNDGSVLLVACLMSDHMNLFEECLYEF